MTPVFRVLLLITAATMSLPSAHAEMSAEAARASIEPFYKALNAAFAQDSAGRVRQATAPEWVSCRGNDVCNSQEEVIAGIAARLKSIPDLTWQIKEVLVSGDHVVVRGACTGTPSGEFFGTPANGKSFKLMSIDVHTLDNGK